MRTRTVLEGWRGSGQSSQRRILSETERNDGGWTWPLRREAEVEDQGLLSWQRPRNPQPFSLSSGGQLRLLQRLEASPQGREEADEGKVWGAEGAQDEVFFSVNFCLITNRVSN